MKNYMVFYTDCASPHVKEFKTLKTAEKFIKIFLEKNSGNDDYWVDVIIEGKLKKAYEGWNSIKHYKY